MYRLLRERFRGTQKRSGKAKRSDETGSIMVIAAALLTVLLGFMALAIDVGALQNHRRRMQTAADAACLSGANEIRRGRISEIINSARREAGTNGFTDGVNSAAVTVNHPPVTGFYVGNDKFVEVSITQTYSTFFGRVLGELSAPVVSRAVAGFGADANGCLYVLDPAGSSLDLESGARLNASCGVTVNSGSPVAMCLKSSSSVTSNEVAITGGWGTANSCHDGTSSPAPVLGVPPSVDPLLHLQAPTVGACTFTNFPPIETNVNLSPGVYCGGITLINNGVANLSPGLYIIKDGGLQMFSSSTIIGTGVTFYFTGYPSAPNQQAGKAFLMESSTVATLSAPTTGDWAGILFFQDRNADPSITNEIKSSGLASFSGAMYFPNNTFRLESSVIVNAPNAVLVARRVEMESSSQLNIGNDFSAFPGGSPIKRVSLVE